MEEARLLVEFKGISAGDRLHRAPAIVTGVCPDGSAPASEALITANNSFDEWIFKRCGSWPFESLKSRQTLFLAVLLK
jgi:hypothetical protein